MQGIIGVINEREHQHSIPPPQSPKIERKRINKKNRSNKITKRKYTAVHDKQLNT
jgi:hypothetical protein